MEKLHKYWRFFTKTRHGPVRPEVLYNTCRMAYSFSENGTYCMKDSILLVELRRELKKALPLSQFHWNWVT